MSLNSIFQMLDRDKKSLQLLTDVLNDMKFTSYDFLYEVEKNLCGITKIHYNYDSPYIEHEESFCFEGRINFVNHTHRKKIKDLNYYGRLFDLTYIIDNPDMFPNIPLVFINGDLYTNIVVQPNEDVTNFYIYGISKVDFPTIHDENFQMSIILVPVQNVSTGVNINLSHISDIASSYVTDTMLISYERDPTTNEDYYTKIGRDDPSDDFLFFINNPSDQRSYKKNLFKMIDFSYDIDESILTFKTNQLSEYNIASNNSTKLIHLNNFFKKIHITSEESYFELPILDLPIPTENMIIFEKNNSGWKYLKDIDISILYPSTYVINEAHNELLIFILFNNGKDIIKYKHFNELSLYYRFVVDIMKKYKDRTAPEEILEYDPLDIFFDINNFYDVIQSYVDVGDISLTPTYKINELSRISNYVGTGYLNYLRKLTGDNSVYYIRTKSINNLESRLRLNNIEEINNVNNQNDFSEPHYLFRIAYLNDYEKLHVFVDMKHVVPKIYDDKVYIYMYIPAKYITEDSIIKVEKLKTVSINKQISFSNDYIYIDIPHDRNVVINDIYFSYVDNEGITRYIPEDKYRYYTIYDGETEYIDITNNSFYMYDLLYIKFTDETYVNDIINMHINKEYIVDSFDNITYGTYIKYNIDSSNSLYDISIPTDTIVYGNDIFLSYSTDNREIFINRDMYTIYTQSNISEEFVEITDLSSPLNNYIRIVFNDNGVYNNFDIKLNILKTNFSDDKISLKLDEETNSLYFDIYRPLNNDLSHFIVFSDGLLFPSNNYTITLNNNINGPHKLSIHSESWKYTNGGRFSIIYSPNKYYLAYSNDISSDTRTLNLSGKINKPVNLKWYDIYIDGHQLSSENVDIFSSYKLFTHKIMAKNNITIMQKNLDPPPYSTLSEPTNDLILSYVLNRLDELLLYIMTLHELLNPDLQQFDDEIIRRYPFLFDEFDNLFINPDNDISISSIFGVYELSDIDEDHYINMTFE